MMVKNWKKRHVLISLFVLSILVPLGCGAGRTMVIKAPTEKVTAHALDLVEEEPSVNVPEEVRKKFHEKLENVLYEGKEGKEPPFARGSEFRIRYRFIQFNPGSQASRWFWGGIGNAGEGTMTVEAAFFNEKDEEISKIQCEGKISSGFFGGSFNLALEKAAKEIVKFAEDNYR